MPPLMPETETRLLEAAGQVFAERGFAAATVRDICERAEANVAAINYHYGDKRGLYQAVFRHACACRPVPEADLPAETPPAVRLRTWVRSFLGDLVVKDNVGWPGRLLAREMVEPTGILAEWIESGIRPRFAQLRAILSEIRPGMDADGARRHAMSVVGQIIFYHHARPVIARLAPDLALTEATVEATTEHIVSFSLAGLAAPEAVR